MVPGRGPERYTQLDAFCSAFPQRDAEAVERQFTAYLRKTISIVNTAVRTTRKENYYHRVLLRLLGHREDCGMVSNVKSDDGYSDILVELEEEDLGTVINFKYAENANFKKDCQNAMEQIDSMGDIWTRY